MTAYNCLYIIAIALVVIGWGTVAHADDATSSSSLSTASTSSSQNATAPDGTPVVHKSLHKKKKTTTSTASNSADAAPVVSNSSAAMPTSSVPVIPAATTIAVNSPDPSRTVPPSNSSSLVPAVETGLPVPRHTDGTSFISSTSVPMANLSPNGLSNQTSYHSPGSFSGTSATTVSNYSFVDFPTHKSKNNYPWKTNIYTTMFYIGEGGSSISSTDNKASSFDAEWVSSNHGTDSPYDRNGYASGSHASTVNPFYIALPFNDLVYPDKAREWLPSGWHRPAKDGKPVSACKDRWVEIKAEDGSGHVCYAQWEDVGPLRYDHAEYVFGPERPDTYTKAGLDVSPAVAQYLGLDGQKHATTRWRFVDDEDVPPGAWLKYDEQAVIYEALHHLKSSSPSSNLPIQRASEPIDDQSIDSSQKKVGAAKG